MLQSCVLFRGKSQEEEVRGWKLKPVHAVSRKHGGERWFTFAHLAFS